MVELAPHTHIIEHTLKCTEVKILQCCFWTLQDTLTSLDSLNAVGMIFSWSI